MEGNSVTPDRPNTPDDDGGGRDFGGGGGCRTGFSCKEHRTTTEIRKHTPHF